MERVGRNAFIIKYKKQEMLFNNKELEDLKEELSKIGI